MQVRAGGDDDVLPGRAQVVRAAGQDRGEPQDDGCGEFGDALRALKKHHGCSGTQRLNRHSGTDAGDTPVHLLLQALVGEGREPYLIARLLKANPYSVWVMYVFAAVTKAAYASR